MTDKLEENTTKEASTVSKSELSDLLCDTQTVISFKKHGNKKVKIIKNKYGMELWISFNGSQWVATSIDTDIICLIKEAIINIST